MDDSEEFKRFFLVRILRNTFFAGGVRLFMIMVSIFLIPFMISILGNEKFGILALMGAVTGYVGLLDVGLSSTFIKYISEYHAKGKICRINNIINSGIAFYIVFTCLIIVLSYFLLRIFLRFFFIPTDLIGAAIFAFWMTIITLCVNNIFLIFGTVVTGLQRIDIEYFWLGVVTLMRSGGIIIVLMAGFGIRGVVIINLLAAIIMSVINFFLCKKLIPFMSLNIRKHFSFKILKELVKFGYKLQVAGISTIIFNNIDQVLIGRFCGLEFVTFYQIGAKILEKIKAIPQMLFGSLLPGFSEINAIRDMDLVFETYRRSCKLLALIFLPMMVFFASASRGIILLWVGPGFENAAFVMQILGLSHCIFLFLGLGITLLTATGKTSIVMKISIFQSIMNIALSLTLMLWIGFRGVVYGTLISLLCSFAFLAISINHEMKANLRNLFDKTLLFVFLSNIVGFFCSFLSGFILFRLLGLETRIDGFLIAFSQLICLIAGFLICQIIFKPLSLAEIAVLPSRLSKMKSILRMFAR